MPKDRIFTDQELERMGARTSDLIDAAIDAGDLEEAKRLNHRMVEEFQIGHDGYLEWVTGLMSHIYKRYGDNALFEALWESYGNMQKSMFKNKKQVQLDIRQKVEGTATVLRSHAQPLKIVEDDEKITLMMQPCGSGGRLMLDNKYEPSGSLAKIKKAQHMTFDRSDFPVYCAHCAIGQMLTIKLRGLPVYVILPGKEIGENECEFRVYKDPTKIPSGYFNKFGMEKE